MADELIQSAMEIGGKPNLMQGQFFCKVHSSAKQGKFWIVAFSFYSLKDLKMIVEHCIKSGFEPFDDVINLKVEHATMPDVLQEEGPGCPTHGRKHLKQSKKPGWLFCSAKQADGEFCKYTERA